MYPSKTHCRIVAVAKQTTIHSLKGNKPTKYEITKSHSPKLPVREKGTKCIQILLKETTKDMNQPLVPMLFPILGAHLIETEFLYPGQSWKEPCGMMANLVAENNGNGGLSPNRKKALCGGFRSLGRRVGHRAADWAVERDSEAF